jgi:stearoyl-CoA desaturase (Delta-9 desaturase)
MSDVLTAPRGRSFAAQASLFLFVLLHLACFTVYFYPPTWGLVGLFFASYWVRMWAITVGYHRLLSHRAFRAHRAVQFFIALIAVTALQNGPIWWVSWHRRHHRHTDESADPHSPIRWSFWHAHVGWVFDGHHDRPDDTSAVDLLRYPELVWLEKYNKWIVALCAAALWIFGGSAAFLYGFLLSTVVLSHATFCINSVGHLWGTQRYVTGDWSRNNALLAALTLGEGWHNNHHHCQSSARQGLAWWEIDPSYYSIVVMSWLGLVWRVRRPSGAAQITTSASR